MSLTPLNRVTFDEFMDFEPCWGRDRVKTIYDLYPEGMTALDILHREDVPATDKLWAVLREQFIPARTLHEFACICAEYALSLINNPDPRSVAAIETKRRWLDGKATDEELVAAFDAAWAAARAAARDSVWAAARDAALDAALGAARDAAYYSAVDTALSAARGVVAGTVTWAAGGAVRESQCVVLEMMLEEEETK